MDLSFEYIGFQLLTSVDYTSTFLIDGQWIQNQSLHLENSQWRIVFLGLCMQYLLPYHQTTELVSSDCLIHHLHAPVWNSSSINGLKLSLVLQPAPSKMTNDHLTFGLLSNVHCLYTDFYYF